MNIQKINYSGNIALRFMKSVITLSVAVVMLFASLFIATPAHAQLISVKPVQPLTSLSASTSVGYGGGFPSSHLGSSIVNTVFSRIAAVFSNLFR